MLEEVTTGVVEYVDRALWEEVRDRGSWLSFSYSVGGRSMS
jgi:hypothetical protein